MPVHQKHVAHDVIYLLRSTLFQALVFRIGLRFFDPLIKIKLERVKVKKQHPFFCSINADDLTGTDLFGECISLSSL